MIAFYCDLLSSISSFLCYKNYACQNFPESKIFKHLHITNLQKSSKIFKNRQKSSKIFTNFRKKLGMLVGSRASTDFVPSLVTSRKSSSRASRQLPSLEMEKLEKRYGKHMDLLNLLHPIYPLVVIFFWVIFKEQMFDENNHP